MIVKLKDGTERDISIGSYRHFKGYECDILTFAKHTETGETLVVYWHKDGPGIWARPLEMFASEVDHKKYPDVKQRFRFERVES